jgi:hypothetical protein
VDSRNIRSTGREARLTKKRLRDPSRFRDKRSRFPVLRSVTLDSNPFSRSERDASFALPDPGLRAGHVSTDRGEVSDREEQRRSDKAGMRTGRVFGDLRAEFGQPFNPVRRASRLLGLDRRRYSLPSVNYALIMYDAQRAGSHERSC